MPLYDCVMLLKPHVKKESLMDLVARVSKHVYARNGVLTDIKSFGTVQLGYGIKKLDGRYFQPSLRFGPLVSLELGSDDISEAEGCKGRRGGRGGTKGQLMQMTMMATPNINKELHYLNKEDRLLRWLLVKHRDTKIRSVSIAPSEGTYGIFTS
ncbi:hypothetical protein Cgig2_002903 [Carnegiea gigantea]|uniref:Ribosomal protein S6 n=1 Tax=Carnegiea gigantea TaxID=171969 RepID=A0A9Q1KLM2_9CARY|nr:hypothetical protein Cgig2_002903 [Carnegiea gigantea]